MAGNGLSEKTCDNLSPKIIFSLGQSFQDHPETCRVTNIFLYFDNV